MPLFTSPTLNISEIEVDIEGLSVWGPRLERNERGTSSAAFQYSNSDYLVKGKDPDIYRRPKRVFWSSPWPKAGFEAALEARAGSEAASEVEGRL